MLLLRTIVTTLDAAVGALLYLVVVRTWGDRRAAAIATALHQLLPLDFQIVTIANLTNAFAQSLATASLAAVSAVSVRLERIGVIVLLACLFASAFLSHLSTFAILSVTLFAVAAIFAWRGDAVLRSSALAVAVATAAAVALAVLVYYAHFMDTYRSELTRLGAETATAATDAGGRSIGARALAIPHNLHTTLGVPAVLLTAWGALSLWRRGARDRLTLSLAGWAVACLAFLLLGVLTPVDMRYYLASLPAVAIAAAAGVSDGWAKRGAWRAVVAGLVLWVVWLGVEGWWGALR